MLANVLKSEQAITMSIRIIEIFVKLREVWLTHKDILLKIRRQNLCARSDLKKRISWYAFQMKRHPPMDIIYLKLEDTDVTNLYCGIRTFGCYADSLRQETLL
jgi:hypothetical protein